MTLRVEFIACVRLLSMYHPLHFAAFRQSAIRFRPTIPPVTVVRFICCFYMVCVTRSSLMPIAIWKNTQNFRTIDWFNETKTIQKFETLRCCSIVLNYSRFGRDKIRQSDPTASGTTIYFFQSNEKRVKIVSTWDLLQLRHGNASARVVLRPSVTFINRKKMEHVNKYYSCARVCVCVLFLHLTRKKTNAIRSGAGNRFSSGRWEKASFVFLLLLAKWPVFISVSMCYRKLAFISPHYSFQRCRLYFIIFGERANSSRRERQRKSDEMEEGEPNVQSGPISLSTEQIHYENI